MSYYAVSDSGLRAIILKVWHAGRRKELDLLWGSKILPALRAKEQELSARTQKCFAAPLPDIYDDFIGNNPHEGSDRLWWQAAPAMLNTHIDQLTEYASTLYAEFSEWGIAQRQAREAEAKAKADAAAKTEQERRDKLKSDFRDAALSRFVKAGGDVKDFDEAFPRIWQKHLEEQALEDAPRPMPQYIQGTF